jgi:GT2 family glycosyltransferase
MNVSLVTPWYCARHLIPDYEHAARGAETIIVDNGSDAETAAALVAMCERLGNGSRVIRNEENRYFAPACNQAIDAATGDIIVCLNNDVVAREGWLDMVRRDVGPDMLIGPSACLFETVREIQQTPGLVELVQAGHQFPYIEGWCVAARADVWRRLGGFDAALYPLPYVEDVDLSWRARRHGCRLMRSFWRIRHIGGATTRVRPDAFVALQRNAAAFVARVKADLTPLVVPATPQPNGDGRGLVVGAM